LESLGDLLVRRADIFTEREGHALALRKREQHLQNLAASLLLFYRSPGLHVIGLGERIGHSLDRDDSRRRSTADLGDRSIRHDPAQPRLEPGCGARWRTIAPEGTDNVQKCVLNRIARVRVPAQYAVSDVVGPLLIHCEEASEGVLIAPKCARNEHFIGDLQRMISHQSVPLILR
jgi:hypothetical protein